MTFEIQTVEHREVPPSESAFVLAFLLLENVDLLRSKSVSISVDHETLLRHEQALGVALPPALVALFEGATAFRAAYGTDLDELDEVAQRGRAAGVVAAHLLPVGGDAERWLVLDRTSGALGHVTAEDGFAAVQPLPPADAVLDYVREWVDDLVDGTIHEAIEVMRWERDTEESTDPAVSRIQHWCRSTPLHVDRTRRALPDVPRRHVVHAKFGAGVVLEEDTRGPEPKLTVRFEDANDRVLLARFLRDP